MGQTFQGGTAQAQTREEQKKQDETARKDLEETLAEYTPLIRKGDEALAAGKPEEALKLFELAAEKRPRFWIAHHRIGMAFRALGRTEEAIRSLEKANSLSERALVHDSLMNIHLEKGDAAGAVAHGKRAVELEPKSWHTHSALGRCYAVLGRTDESVASFRKAVSIEATAPAFVGLGWALFERKDYDGARESFAKAAKIDPAAAPAVHEVEARIARAKGDLDTAAAEMVRAVEAAPNDRARQGLREDLGEIYLAQGDYAKASYAFGRKNIIGAAISKGALGMAVGSVLRNGPSELAGIRKGDVIVEFEGRPLSDVPVDKFVKDMVGAAPFGDTVRLKIERNGEFLDKAVVVGIPADLPKLAKEANAPSPAASPALPPEPVRIDAKPVPVPAPRFEPSLRILSAVVDPSPVPANADFRVLIRLKADVLGGRKEISVSMSCTILSGGRVVFQAPDSRFEVPNGGPVDVEKSLSAGPEAGAYTVLIKLAGAGLAAEDALEFTVR